MTITTQYGCEEMMGDLSELRIGFDSGGGITLFAPKYCHEYQDGRHAAVDVALLLKGGADTDLWDGHDQELWQALEDEPGEWDEYDQVYTLAEVKRLLAEGKVIVDDYDVHVFDGRRANSMVAGQSESDFWQSLVAGLPQLVAANG
jgi:hypothetical protein